MESTTAVRKWDVASHLSDLDACAAYLTAALAENDAALFIVALGDVVRARGLADVAREAGEDAEHLTQVLGADGDPEFELVARVMRALTLSFRASL